MIRQVPSTIFKTSSSSSFCPGCGHGIANRLIAEVLDEKGISGKTVAAYAVGCCVLNSTVMNVSTIQSPHGRAAAVATGTKRVRPDHFVFTYQGDGDAASIGLAETLYAAERNDNITVFFVNNTIYGMTGGQMAPTTLPGQKATTARFGRDITKQGDIVRLAELLNNFKVGYLARGSVHSVKEINKTKKLIKKAVDCQMSEHGYSFVEILSPCPTNWGLNPLKSLERIENEMISYYPLGELQCWEAEN